MLYLDFDNDKVIITFFPHKETKESKYTIKVYGQAADGKTAKTHVYTTAGSPLEKGKENHYYFQLDYIFYINTAKKVAGSSYLPNVIAFTFAVVIGDKETEARGDFKVHFIRYIPKLMNIKGWANGEKLQRIWFTKGLNDDRKKVDPVLDAVTWGWLLAESAEVKSEYNEFHATTVAQLDASNMLTSNKVQTALTNEINRMSREGMLKIPDKSNPVSTFGAGTGTIITHNGERMPMFEKYYFNSKSFSGIWDLGKHYLSDGIDDFIAALANFNFHVYATGELHFKEGTFKNYVEVQVKKLYYYIKDSFDFIDDDPSESQPLGYWKVSDDGKNVEVVKDAPSQKKQYFMVTNKSYRDYRDVHKKGYDFYLYSNLKIWDTTIKFEL